MKCAICGSLENLTIDHIIPKWAYKRAQFLAVCFVKNLGKENRQILCKNCNGSKSGKIDVRNPVGRLFWTMVRDEINKALIEQI